MKRIAIVLALWIVLVGAGSYLSGCAGTFKPTPIAELKMPASMSEAGKYVQGLIREINVGITAAYLTIATDVEEGTMSAEDQTSYLTQLGDFEKKADAAQAALNLGNIADAKTQAEALNKLVLALQKKAKEHK